MNDKNELKILKSAIKQLENPDHIKHSMYTSITMIAISLIIMFITMVLFKQQIVTAEFTVITAYAAGAGLGVSVILVILIKQSEYLQRFLSLSSMRDRVKDLESKRSNG